MTRPIKFSRSQFKRLERNLDPAAAGPAKSDEALVSFLHRVFWSNYRAITGKSYGLREIHDPRIKLMLDRFVKEYLPELKRKLK